MKGGNDRRKVVSMLDLAMRLRDLEAGAEQRLRCRRSEAHNQVRLDGFQFCFQPRAAGMDLFHAGLLVNTELAARLPSKVLHCVGDIDLSPVYIRFFETLIQ